MNGWGMLIGGALGFFLGGPIGALIGALLGGSFSVGVARSGWTPADSARVQNSFFNAAFSVMGYIAKADGQVSADEIRAARAVMAHMNLNADQQRAAIDLFNRGKQPGFPLEDVLHQLRADARGRRDVLRMFLQIQLHAALADGVMHPAERAVFDRIGAALGISQIEIQQFEEFVRAQQSFGGKSTPQTRGNRLDAAYHTLGVRPETSDADVKTAYRRLMKENHPDKLVSRGLPEAMLKLAQEKVQQINAAYDVIKEARGIK